MQQLQSIQETVESNDVAFGARVATFSPAIIEIYGDLGLDYAWLDFEHGGPSADDVHQIAQFVRTAVAADIDLIARLPSDDPSLVRRVLDAGIRTLLIPRIETAEEIRRVVEASRFSLDGDIGERGIGGERSSNWGDFPERYTDLEDESVFVGAMIENQTAVENIGDIVTVRGLGFVFLGPADLSVSLGRPLQPDHPEVEQAVEVVRSTAVNANTPIGRITSDVDEASRAIDDGYSILRIGGEISATRRILTQRIEEIKGNR